MAEDLGNEIRDRVLKIFKEVLGPLIDELIAEFGNTYLGQFKVNASLGTNFGNMKRMR